MTWSKGSVLGIAFIWSHKMFHVAQSRLCAWCEFIACPPGVRMATQRTPPAHCGPRKHRQRMKMDAIDKLVDESSVSGHLRLVTAFKKLAMP